ncbi:Lrp/AsnC family transcriptional regulator [Poseidonocella sp. HB161398]|uniref:Lrp/AsnC family transcriptional regulator n=1 Tax=Poseidonocella sp. HB161398 TaxID=2320855 RepID=UPI0011094C57|nr:Lrp/AsnC family transcriptional regulator [Poseidonocella sp. HB161398]
MELDRIDRKIVAALMADATLPLARLAGMVGLSQTPCWKRVRKLQSSGVIRGRVALVDPERIGFGLTVFVSLSAPDQAPAWQDRLEEVLSEIPEVMEAYQLAGQYDHLLRIVVRDMAEFERVRKRLANAIELSQLSVHFATRRLKNETVLPLDTLTA